jgi:hypothetical protein
VLVSCWANALLYCCTVVPQVIIIDRPTGRERTKSVWDGGLHQVSA